MTTTLAPLHALLVEDTPQTARARLAAEWIRGMRSYRWVGIYEVTAEEIVALAWTGSQAPAFPRFPRTHGLTGAAVASQQPVIVQDVTKDPRYLTAFGSTQSEAIFPIRGRTTGPIVGTLDVESDQPQAFTPEDQVFLGACAEALTVLWDSTAPRDAV